MFSFVNPVVVPTAEEPVDLIDRAAKAKASKPSPSLTFIPDPKPVYEPAALRGCRASYTNHKQFTQQHL